MTTYTAKLNYLRMTPRKVRSIAGLIRGLSVNEAEAQLFSQSRRASGPLLKLLRSAVANAKNNKASNVDHLFIAEIRVDQGPMLKRFLPRARGSASPIQKKMSHVTLTLGTKDTLTSKFTIVPKKKKKLPPESDHGRKVSNKRSKVSEEKEPEGEQKGKPGFFKKVFNRKSGMGN